MLLQDFLNTDHVQRNRWWHWLLGFALIIACWIFGTILLYIILLLAQIEVGSKAAQIGEFSILFASFLPAIFGIWLITKFWHKESFLNIFTASQKFRWDYVGRTALIVTITSFVFTGLNYLISPSDYDGFQLNSDLSLYWKLLIITLILVPFQAASEELLLRGYLNRALGRYLKNPWILFCITSAGFAALHGWNAEAEGQLWPYLTLIFTFGFFMCVLLYFEGGIESAISYHIVNNFFAFSIIGYREPGFPDSSLLVSDVPDIVWSDTLWTVLMMSITCAFIIWANRKWGHMQQV